MTAADSNLVEPSPELESTGPDTGSEDFNVNPDTGSDTSDDSEDLLYAQSRDPSILAEPCTLRTRRAQGSTAEPPGTTPVGRRHEHIEINIPMRHRLDDSQVWNSRSPSVDSRGSPDLSTSISAGRSGVSDVDGEMLSYRQEKRSRASRGEHRRHLSSSPLDFDDLCAVSPLLGCSGSGLPGTPTRAPPVDIAGHISPNGQRERSGVEKFIRPFSSFGLDIDEPVTDDIGLMSPSLLGHLETTPEPRSAVLEFETELSQVKRNVDLRRQQYVELLALADSCSTFLEQQALPG